MAYLCFRLEHAPDLTLGQYASLDESGVKGVLEKTGAFLRQLNRKGVLSNVYFHLLYVYRPEEGKGQRLKAYFLASGKPSRLERIRELVQHSAASAFFRLICMERAAILWTDGDSGGAAPPSPQTASGANRRIALRNHLGHEYAIPVAPGAKFFRGAKPGGGDIVLSKLQRHAGADSRFAVEIREGHVVRMGEDDGSIRFSDEQCLGLPSLDESYGYMAFLGKRGFFLPSAAARPDKEDLEYYRMAQWKMRDQARLYDMFKLMEGMGQRAAFRVDIFPVDYAHDLRRVLPIKALRDAASPSMPKTPGSFSQARDENAEETIRQYGDWIKEYESSPHFRANITAFADHPDVAELVVDAAAAEALESGTYVIRLKENSAPEAKPQTGAESQKAPFDLWHSMGAPIDAADPKTARELRFLSNLYLLEELRPFFSFPALYDGESIEIPKETAPKPVQGGMPLGIDFNGYDAAYPIKLLRKHAFLAGVPGSGKTNTMLHIATELWTRFRVPFLILEPAKKEYRALSRLPGMDDLLLFSPSSGTNFPLHINPFEFPGGMALSEHINNLMSVFEGAFTLAGPAPFLVDRAVEQIYQEKGWRADTKNPNARGGDVLPYPTVSDLFAKLKAVVDQAGYTGEIRSNLQSFIEVRIGSLLRREMGDVFDVRESTLPPGEWLERPVLIELEAMGSGPANFLTLLLSTLVREALKTRPTAPGRDLRHVIFFEEAHNLIGPEAVEATGENADPKLAATAYVVKMLAEVRALGEGIVIADQLPTKMAPEVIKNTGLKICHRLTAEDDRGLMGSTMAASPEQLERMATMGVGECYVSYEGLLRPFQARIHKWREDDALFVPPTNEELAQSLMDRLEKELAENRPEGNETGSMFALKRNMEITCAKFESRHAPLENRRKSWLVDLKAFFDQKRKNAPTGASDAAWDEPEAALAAKLDAWLAEMSDLFECGKGWWKQNTVYKSRMYGLLSSCAANWVYLHTKALEAPWNKVPDCLSRKNERLEMEKLLNFYD